MKHPLTEFQNDKLEQVYQAIDDFLKVTAFPKDWRVRVLRRDLNNALENFEGEV